MNIREACHDWRRNNLTIWGEMKNHFSTEIQMNKTGSLVMQRQQQANTVLKQASQQQEDHNKNEVAILQTQKIQALEEKLGQQMANNATSVGGGSVPD